MAGGSFGGGTGTAASPYLIEDAADLYQIRNKLTAYYKLVSNINLGVAPYNSGKGWVPIVGFAGNINGNGKKIHNLYINRPDEDYVGLIKQISIGAFTDMQKIRITDLCLENVDITGRDYVGAILGDYTIGDLRGNPNDASYAVFTRCSVQGKVKGRSMVGGFGGRYYWDARSSTYYTQVAYNCVSDVTIIPTPGGSYYGQMFGWIRDYWNGQYNVFYLFNCVGKGKIDNSLVAEPSNVGAFCWHNQGSYLVANTCRYDKELWPKSTVVVNENAAVGWTTTQMRNPANFKNLLDTLIIDSIPMWCFFAGKYPELYFQSPDYLFVYGDGGFYTYHPSNGWTIQYTATPSRQQAIEKGMRHLEYIPQSAWDYFKSHGDPYILNILDKADTFSIFATPFNFAKDVANSNNSKTIFRKEIAFINSGGNLATINI